MTPTIVRKPHKLPLYIPNRASMH